MKNLFLISVLALIALFSCSNQPKKDAATTVSAYKPVPTKATQFALPYASIDTSVVIEKFAFGSCNDQNKEQPLWKVIASENPQLMIMMGDNVYASGTQRPIIDQYIKLNSQPDYKDLKETTPFLATWDDHDYGKNDGGFSNPDKNEARSLFVNYWGYLKNSLPKNQEAIYHSRLFGKNKQRVHYILLDSRWNKTENNILSDEQWNWLKTELKKPAELKFIVSSIQVLATDHRFEKWSDLPEEKQKLLNLIKDLKLKNVIFLSGDRHLASIAKIDIDTTTSKKMWSLYDITSSSLNKKSPAKEPENDQTYIQPVYMDINYGLAQIDWKKKQVVIDIKDKDNKAVLSQTIPF